MDMSNKSHDRPNMVLAPFTIFIEVRSGIKQRIISMSEIVLTI